MPNWCWWDEKVQYSVIGVRQFLFTWVTDTFHPLQLRKPPPVIPYHRHIEGKKKLAESLKQQSSSDMSAGILLSLTPPDTPRYTPLIVLY